MLHPMICKISEQALQLAKQRRRVIAILMPIMVALIFFARSYRNPGALIGPAIITLLVVEAILVIETDIVIRNMKAVTLTTSAEALERTAGRFTEKINAGDIHQIDIHEDPSGEIASIAVKLKNRRMITLGGFDHMKLIARQIEEAVSDKSLIHGKRHATDWNEPSIIVAIATLALAGVLVIRGSGREAFQVFYVLFLLAYGLYSFVSRPLTRSLGQRFAKFEIIMSAFIIVGVVRLAIGIFR